MFRAHIICRPKEYTHQLLQYVQF